MTEHEDFATVEDLDKFLLEEAAKEAKEDEEIVEEPEDEESEEEEEEPADEDSDDEDEPEEEPEPKPKKTKEEKEAYAFAKLRKEASEAKKALEDREALVTQLMKEAGYKNYDEFKDAVTEQVSKKEMKEKGYSEEQFKELDESRRKIKELEAKLEANKAMEERERAHNFDSLVKSYAKDFNLKAGDIYAELQDMGYTVATLLAQPKPEVLLKGLMADKGQPKTKPVKKAVDTERIPSGNNGQEKFDADALLEKELAEYKKRKGNA